MSSRIGFVIYMAFVTIVLPVCSFAQDNNVEQLDAAAAPSADNTEFFAELPPSESDGAKLGVAARTAFTRHGLRDRQALFAFVGIEAIFENIGAWRSSTIPVCLFTQSPGLTIEAAELSRVAGRIRAVASEWNAIAGVPDFDFGPGTDIQRCAGTRFSVAIMLSPGASSSYVGVTSREMAQGGLPTMTLEAGPMRGTDERLFRSLVLHEFGHALGLLHEIQHADGECWSKFDPPKLFAYYRDRFGENDQDAIRSKLATYDRAIFDSTTTSLDMDPDSIMMYSFPEDVYTDPSPPCRSPLNTRISPGDRETLQLAYGQTRGGLMQLASLAGALPPEDRRVVDAYITLMGAEGAVQQELFAALANVPAEADPEGLADAVFAAAHSQRVQAMMAAGD